MESCADDATEEEANSDDPRTAIAGPRTGAMVCGDSNELSPTCTIRASSRIQREEALASGYADDSGFAEVCDLAGVDAVVGARKESFATCPSQGGPSVRERLSGRLLVNPRRSQR